LTVVAALAGQAGEAPSLIGPTWVAIELAGTPVPLTPAERQPSLEFVAGGRVAGSDGCNRVRATYRLDGERLSFGPVAATRMACPGLESVIARFEAALRGTVRFELAGGRLRLFGRDDVLLVAFEARRGGGATAGEEPAPAAPPPATPPAASGAPLRSQVFDWASLQGGRVDVQEVDGRLRDAWDADW
jgi:heat shock protein HslJ